MPDTDPGNIGPPNADKSTLDIVAILSWLPSQTPDPTNNSPTVPWLSIIPAWSNNPISSPSFNVEILFWKINNVDYPVSSIFTLKCWVNTIEQKINRK